MVMITCSDCKKKSKNRGHNLCNTCYFKRRRQTYNQPKRVCILCESLKKIKGNDLCRSCYNKNYKTRIFKCPKCGEQKPIFSNNLCQACYSKRYMEKKPITECEKCGEVKKICYRNLCWTCYHKDQHPIRYYTHIRIMTAINSGKIPSAKDCKCELCQDKAEHYHHPDYSKPLQVIPLCVPCHINIHK